MKKIVLVAFLVLSFIITGNAFALDDNPDPTKRSTNMFIQQDDDGPSIKALVGSDNIPLVDEADIRDPNFVGDRNFSTPPVQNYPHDRSIKGPAGINAPGQTGTPASPVQP